MVQQLGIFLFAADGGSAASQPSIVETVETLLLGAVPTLLLFVVLVLAYQFLVQGPLSRTLKERHARTEGAIEEAHKAIARAEERAQEYATRLRQARADVFKIREQRIKQWTTERDAALDAARKAAGEKVSQAKAALEAEAAGARKSIEASAGELASRVVRAILPAAAGGTR
ncbi:ATP synthase F0 subunit B [Acidobacteria bacterium AB60]|nr:ATP synthase F0 subunit B [Acidobacteria bacterium AB60]